MKRMVLALLVGGLVLVPGTIRAQGQDLPPVLDPAEVFTEAVEVVETLPILNVDNAARLVYTFDPGTNAWTAYPYPDELLETDNIIPRSNGQYIVGQPYYRPDWPDQEVWLFDPGAGKFFRPDRACGRVKALPGEGTWTFYQNPENGLFHLCLTETGELSRPLPEGLQSDLCDYYGRQPSVSPDGSWVVFADCKGDSGQISFYAYEVLTGRVNLLGLRVQDYNQFDEFVGVDRWADETHPILYSDSMRNPSQVSYYVADVTRSRSLVRIFGSLRYSNTWNWLKYYDDPPRYEWVPGEWGPALYGSASQTCPLHAYHLDTLQEEIYPTVPGVCGSGIPITAPDDRLFRVLRRQENGTYLGVLVRFNPYTGQATELLSGEFDWLDQVTPDGRYAIITMGNSGGVLEDSARSDSIYWFGEKIQSPYQAIIDLSAKEIVYKTPGVWSQGYGTMSPRIRALNNSVFLLYDAEPIESEFPRLPTHLVRLEDQHTVEESIPDVYLVLPDDRRLLVKDNEGMSWAADIYDTETKELIPAVRALHESHFALSLALQESGLLLIEVEDSSFDYTRSPGSFVVGRWLVRVP